MIDILEIKAEHVVCDVPAWCGYFSNGLVDNLNQADQVTCVEPSPEFAQGVDKRFKTFCCSIMNMPIGSNSIDRLGSLVGLHHLSDRERELFINETFRVIKSTGRIGISEVIHDTHVSNFLNGPVNRFSANGHRGRFLKLEECSNLLRNAGYINITEKFYNINWIFNSEDEMGIFCKGLLGLVKIDKLGVIAAIKDHFDLIYDSDKIKLPWGLMYCTGNKR